MAKYYYITLTIELIIYILNYIHIVSFKAYAYATYIS